MFSGVLTKAVTAVVCAILFLPFRVAGQDSVPALTGQGINKKKLYTSIALEGVFCIAGMSYLNFVWYHDRKSAPFHFDNDNRAYLQMDKFGHVFGGYAESYIGYKLLRNAGVGKGPALWYGGTLGLVLQTPIEIFDAIHDGWGFSWGDEIANALGSSLVIGQELLFNEQVVKYKWSYRPPPDRLTASGTYVKEWYNRILLDYNAHSYWLSVPLCKIFPNSKIPPWLCISPGYSAGGMFGKYENVTSFNGVPVTPAERYRKYLLSMDIDWTRIKTRSRFLKAILNAMFFIKLPFPAIEFNSMGKIRGYWLY
jgi:hypothetical protein